MNNTDFMAVTCPLSCSVCTHTCNDTHASCPEWAKMGECKENAHWMLKECPTSCGVCVPQCEDSLKECAGWASMNGMALQS